MRLCLRVFVLTVTVLSQAVQANSKCPSLEDQINQNKELTKAYKFSLAVEQMENYLINCFENKTSTEKGYVQALNQLVYAKFKSRHVTQEKEKTIDEANTAVSLSIEQYGAESAVAGYAYSNLGNIFMTIGDYKQALSNHIASLKIREKVLSNDHEDIGTTYNDIGYSYRHLQKFDESRQALEKAIIIRKIALPKNHPDVGWSINNLANLLSDLGHYDESINLYKGALSIFNENYEDNSPAIAGVINNIGTIYHLKGDLDKVEPYYQKALNSYREAYGHDHPQVALVLNNLGELYLEQGHDKKALELFESSVAIRIKINGHYNSNLAWTYSYIAQLLSTKGLFEQAEGYIELALDVWYQLNGEIPLNRLKTLSTFAEVAKHQGKYIVAYNRYSRLLDVSTNLLTNLANDSSDFSNAKSIISPILSDVFQFLSVSDVKNQVNQNQQNNLAFKAMQIENWSAVALDSVVYQLNSENNRLVEKYNTLQNDKNSINKELLFALRNNDKPNSSVDDIRAQLDKKNSEITKVKELILSTSQDNSNYLFPLDLDLADVIPRLSDKQILLQYYWGKETSYILTTTNEKTRLIELKISESQINSLIDNAYSSLKFSEDNFMSSIKPFDIEASNRIYNEILASALVEEPNIDSISVVSSGAISKFPLHLLVTEKPKFKIESITDFKNYEQVQWLFKKYSIETLTSLVSRKTNRTNDEPSLLAIGSPYLSGETGQLRGVQEIDVFDSRGLAKPEVLKGLPQLKFANNELLSGLSKFGKENSTLLTGKSATEKAFRQNLAKKYDVIAISTHALLASGGESRPLHSIVLTPPTNSNTIDDGLLTSDEIRKFKLETQLVILSGCNTAASEDGKILGDLTGLASSFIYAGSNNVLVTLWQIEDQSTSKLIDSFYSALNKNDISVKSSLRKAMLERLSTDDLSFYKHPIFWGGFQSVKSSL